MNWTSIVGGAGIVSIILCAFLVVHRERARKQINTTAKAIWQLKDAGRIAGPDAGSLLATLYGDK